MNAKFDFRIMMPRELAGFSGLFCFASPIWRCCNVADFELRLFIIFLSSRLRSFWTLVLCPPHNASGVLDTSLINR